MLHQFGVGGLVFDASFDSGNCARAEQTGADEFAVWTAPDCVGSPHETKFRSWFHFAVGGAAPGRVLTLVVHNMNCQGHLFKHDMRPVVRALPSQPHWERVRYPTHTSGTKAEDNFVLRFRHKVETTDTLFFALCYPQAYTESQAQLAHIDALFGLPPVPPPQPPTESAPACPPPPSVGAPRTAPPLTAPPWQLLESAAALAAADGLPTRRPPGVYYFRELLVCSLGGRRVELLTVSGSEGMLEEEEERLDGLFPDGRPRPRRFAHKQVFFLSGRVHPGETPASHVFDGFLSFLLRDSDPRARRLRERFVFKLVPMLNPDGVYLGHYRADTEGLNLNRLYLYCSLARQPSIAAVGAVIRQLHSRGELLFYIDLHAHANKRGCFLFGNTLPFEQMVDNVLYAKLVSVKTPVLPIYYTQPPPTPPGAEQVLSRARAPPVLIPPPSHPQVATNCRWFDFAGCDFSVKNMVRRDKRDGLSKEGSGRVGVYTMTGLTYVYTLECNYNEGRTVNRLQPVPGGAAGGAGGVSPPGSPPRGARLKYTPGSWREVGAALAVSALDVLGINPASRLGEGEAARVRSAMAAWVRTQARKESDRAAARAARGGRDDEEAGGESDGDGDDSGDTGGGHGTGVSGVASEPKATKKQSAAPRIKAPVFASVASTRLTNGTRQPTVSSRTKPVPALIRNATLHIPKGTRAAAVAPRRAMTAARPKM